MTYQQVAYEVMKLFFSDFTEEELKNCINNAYDSKFDTEEIAVVYEGKTLVYGKDYIIESVLNNKNAGTGYVIIRGLGEYGCTKKVTFVINSKYIEKY